MGNLISDVQLVNDIETSADNPTPEALFAKLGSAINGLVDLTNTLKFETFTADTAFNFPSSANPIAFVYGVGGGGGGGGALIQSSASSAFGGGGGGAGMRRLVTVTLSPGSSYAITIGAGGAGGAKGNPEGAAGVDGTASIFGANLVTFAGGSGGLGGRRSVNTSTFSLSLDGGLGGVGSGNGADGDTTFGGKGGVGLYAYVLAGQNAPANSGSGGGGCAPGADNGGSGGSGLISIIYFDSNT
jgi:hypothetical protein